MEIDIIREIKRISLDKKHRFHFIAKYIIENITEIPKVSITSLAKSTYSSPSTINRFTKSLHLSGYKELIHIIKYFNYTLVDTDQMTKKDINKDNFFIQRYDEVVATLNDTFALILLQKKEIDTVIDRLKEAKRINVFAAGGTFNISKDFQQILLRTGFNIVAANNIHKGHFLAKQSNSETLNIFVSYSGETQDLLDLAKICKENNSQIVVLSKKSNNSLSKIADINLSISSSDPIDRFLSITNRLPLIFYLDMIIYRMFFTNLEYYQDIFEKTALKKV